MDGSVSNAPPTAREKADSPRQEPPRRGRRLFSRRQDGSVRVYQHSNLLYWWPIWVWGYVCAGLTYLQGIGVGELAASRDKTVLFHPSPWLGISFIGVMLFVAVFTNVRAARRLLVRPDPGRCGLVYWLVAHVPGIEHALGWLSLLRVYLNLAFYLTFSTLLLAIWVAIVGVADHFTWWRFSPSQVTEEHFMGLRPPATLTTRRAWRCGACRTTSSGTSCWAGAPAISWSSLPTTMPSRSTTCGAPGTSKV